MVSKWGLLRVFCPVGLWGLVRPSEAHPLLPSSKSSFFFFKYFIYLFVRETEAETQAEGEAGSMQGARRGT